jgi:hypothetical protein
MNTLWDPPPGIQASGSRSAARPTSSDSTAVLGGKGSLRRAKHGRALASCAPPCSGNQRDGRLRREPDAEQFLRLTKTKNQMVVDTHT